MCMGFMRLLDFILKYSIYYEPTLMFQGTKCANVVLLSHMFSDYHNFFFTEKRLLLLF